MSFFRVTHTKQQARVGELQTDHGVVRTPVFMPVGTQATVKSLDAEDLRQTGAQIMLSNTYHLWLRPGEENLLKMGGLHSFMNWSGPILTDSGGFQAFSLGDQMEARTEGGDRAARVTAEGVQFRSHLDGAQLTLTPEKAIQIQHTLGSDIMMVLDDVVADDVPVERVKEAVERSIRWGDRCIVAWDQRDRRSAQGHTQQLFGIIQGGQHKELRQASAEHIASKPYAGIAFGGESIGYDMQATGEIMDWVRDLLPKDKPRYAMGLGRDPQNIIDAVRWGFDMFDCVGPSRLARNGALFVGAFEGSADKPDSWQFSSPFSHGRLQIGQASWAGDTHLLSDGVGESCDCYTCSQGYTRGYLHHLYKAHELLYFRLATAHNIRVMVRLADRLGMRHNGI